MSDLRMSLKNLMCGYAAKQSAHLSPKRRHRPDT